MNGSTTGNAAVRLLVAAVVAATAAGCAGPASAGRPDAQWGIAKGEVVELHTLENENGLEVEVTEYGARVVTVRVPDREGRLQDITLGYDSLAGYRDDEAFMGAVVGRYANRIAAGRFALDGQRHQLPVNNPPNHLHGGPRGFSEVVWTAEPVEARDGEALRLSYTSPAGEEGYPGTLEVEVTVTLTDSDELVFDFRATTDAATPVNLAQHSYWNLGGHGADDVLDHRLTINASRFLPVDSTLIPTGELRPVEGTPFDFRRPTPIGARIEADDPQLERGHGYDHTWVLDGETGELSFAARLVDPASGRVLDVYTTQPGLQVYTGNWLDGVRGKDGARYGPHAGVALEAQHFPDSPNQSAFPSTILRPGEEFRARTLYRFSVSP